ncbi:hypothetical protein CRG98_026461 [Punica granatum]|uniref:Uncharacterized protein n=1 Tax=Punica granatum TaxID=22663 RepID=A0A2I0JBX2_PUNGR|nr:hypothetical protein CRG98_026461 [Punica granatum]
MMKVYNGKKVKPSRACTVTHGHDALLLQSHFFSFPRLPTAYSTETRPLGLSLAFSPSYRPSLLDGNHRRTTKKTVKEEESVLYVNQSPSRLSTPATAVSDIVKAPAIWLAQILAGGHTLG